ncbi:MAG: hypothetical protein ACUVQS_04730 [Candidatus Bipolaricaulaceae bacterium]
MVLKTGSPFGRLQALETLAHSQISLYSADPPVRSGFLSVRGPILWENGRPVAYVETYGHGISGHSIELKRGTIVYRPGEAAQLPQGINDKASYALVAIYDTLWPRRHEIGSGKLFDQPFEDRGVTRGAAFDGDHWGEDKANFPGGTLKRWEQNWRGATGSSIRPKPLPTTPVSLPRTAMFTFSTLTSGI